MNNRLRFCEREMIDPETLENKILKNRIVVLYGQKTSVLVGEGLSLKINASVGLNSQEEFDVEQEKIRTIRDYKIKPDIMMDLSTKRIARPLYDIIAREIGCPVGTIPYYTCFDPKRGIDKDKLLELIEEQAKAGVSFMTLHLTADLRLAEQAMTRKIPVISRGGSLLLRDMKINKRKENILISNLNEILNICKKHHVVVNIGTTFRPSTLHDALDNINLQEIKKQKKLSRLIIDSGVHVQMEGLGHIPLLKIPEYICHLRKDIYIPFMPLGPIVSDRTRGQDHITAAVGASYMAALGGADVINAVTREEHTGGIPTIHSILEAIDTASTVATIVNDARFPKLYESVEDKYHNCMGVAKIMGCSRCGQECPFIWNDEIM